MSKYGPMYFLAHRFADGSHVLSIDFLRHHDEGLVVQADILDELLQQPEPLPMPPPPTPPPRTPSPQVVFQEPGSSSNAFGVSTRAYSPVKTPIKRMQHNLLTDALIYKYVDVHGPKWRELSSSLGGRGCGYSDDVVRNRYIRICEALGQPYQTTRVRTKTPKKPDQEVERWSELEDNMIKVAISMHGTKWSSIYPIFKGKRTQQAIRNRANRLGLANVVVIERAVLQDGPNQVRVERKY